MISHRSGALATHLRYASDDLASVFLPCHTSTGPKLTSLFTADRTLYRFDSFLCVYICISVSGIYIRLGIRLRRRSPHSHISHKMVVMPCIVLLFFIEFIFYCLFYFHWHCIRLLLLNCWLGGHRPNAGSLVLPLSLQIISKKCKQCTTRC